MRLHSLIAQCFLVVSCYFAGGLSFGKDSTPIGEFTSALQLVTKTLSRQENVLFEVTYPGRWIDHKAFSAIRFCISRADFEMDVKWASHGSGMPAIPFEFLSGRETASGQISDCRLSKPILRGIGDRSEILVSFPTTKPGDPFRNFLVSNEVDASVNDRSPTPIHFASNAESPAFATLQFWAFNASDILKKQTRAFLCATSLGEPIGTKLLLPSGKEVLLKTTPLDYGCHELTGLSTTVGGTYSLKVSSWSGHEADVSFKTQIDFPLY